MLSTTRDVKLSATDLDVPAGRPVRVLNLVFLGADRSGRRFFVQISDLDIFAVRRKWWDPALVASGLSSKLAWRTSSARTTSEGRKEGHEPDSD